MKINDNAYFVVQSWMVNKLKLKGAERDVFAIIYGYCQDGESDFHGSIAYIAKLTGYSKNSICKALNSLTESGLIVKTEESLNNIKYCRYTTKLDTHTTKLDTGYPTKLDSIQLPCTNIYINDNDIDPIDNSNIENREEDNREKEEEKNRDVGFIGSIKTIKQEKDSERINSFLELYNSLELPRIRKLNTKRKKAILNILDNFTQEEVNTALNNFSQSDFLLGKISSFEANLDWILKEDNFIKILEGKYNNRTKKTSNHGFNDNAVSETYTEEELEHLKEVERERESRGLQTRF